MSLESGLTCKIYSVFVRVKKEHYLISEIYIYSVYVVRSTTPAGGMGGMAQVPQLQVCISAFTTTKPVFCSNFFWHLRRFKPPLKHVYGGSQIRPSRAKLRRLQITAAQFSKMFAAGYKPPLIKELEIG